MHQEKLRELLSKPRSRRKPREREWGTLFVHGAAQTEERKVPSVGEEEEAGGTADSGGGEQPEQHFEVVAAAGEWMGVGGVRKL